MNEYIYENNFSIPEILCDDIMKTYEKNYIFHYQGTTQGGIQKNVKNTRDFIIPKSTNETDEWYKIENFLYKELHKNFKIYIEKIHNKSGFKPENNNGNEYKSLQSEQVVDNFMIQKYTKNIGQYTYHNDYRISIDEKRHRTVTYLWYLNDVDEGGETEFWGTYKIKPRKGKLILFPASWCFPHRGIMPISSDKYIITGWFYQEII